MHHADEFFDVEDYFVVQMVMPHSSRHHDKFLKKRAILLQTEPGWARFMDDDLELFKFALKRRAIKDNIPEFVCEHGLNNVLKWYFKNNLRPTGFMLQKAARNGHLECLKTIHEHKTKWYTDMKSDDLYSAAYRGQLECIKFVVNVMGLRIDEDLILGAACGGHLNVLQFVHDTAPETDYSKRSYLADMIYCRANVECIKYCYDYMSTLTRTPEVTAAAAEMGNLEMLQWLHERGCPWSETTVIRAAKAGNVECLSYAIEQGCPFYRKDAQLAAIRHYNWACAWRLGVPKSWLPENSLVQSSPSDKSSSSQASP